MKLKALYNTSTNRYDKKLTAEHVLEERASLVKIFASKVKAQASAPRATTADITDAPMETVVI